MLKINKYLFEFKDVLKNFSYTLIYQVLALVLPIITVPYVTRILNQDLIGLNSILQANCSYFELVGMLGITLLGPREIAKCLGEREKLSETFFSIYKIQFFMHLVVMFIYGGYVSLIVREPLGYFYYIYLIAYMFDISWLFIGIEDFKSVTIRNVFIRLLSFASLFLLVKRDRDIYIYVATLYVPQILINIYMWYIALTKYVDFRIDAKIKRFFVLEAISLFLPQIASSIYTMLDKTVLGIFSTYAVAAVYTQGQTLLKLFYAVVPSFCKVMSPRIATCIERKDEVYVYRYMRMSCHVVSAISFLLFFGLLATAKIFVAWYLPAGYSQTADVLMICAPIILMVSGANLISIEYLIPLGQQRKYTISVVTSAILNLILNFSLAPFLGVYGVCIGSVTAETAGLLIQLFYARKYINLKKVFFGVYVYFFAGLIMFILLKKLIRFLIPSFFSILCVVIVGGVIYGILVLVFRKLLALRHQY